MKVSLNTIRQYIDFDLSPVDGLVSTINQRLGQVEGVTDLASRYADVVIVKVVSCEKHGNADKLSVCMVDDGGLVESVERDEQGFVQVVCGAPNARAGIFAAWLPPKATVPVSFEDDQPFVLDAREIRGVQSNGMLAAADELALGGDHTGIIEITEADIAPQQNLSLKPGVSFAAMFGLDDTIIEIENKMFTHRPDLFGQLGVAREIAGIYHKQFVSPGWYLDTPKFASVEGFALEVFNDAEEKVPRFMAVALKNVTVRPSPLWLQIELVRLGGKPINNIVDITNYVMLLTAQPTHAYDYDKLRGGTLGVRMAEEGEKATLLNGKNYKLSADDIVIVDGEGVIGLGGVMGGGNSEVSSETKNIVLEVATFDMYAVRKTSMRHGLFTDAVTRFNKGQSPLQNNVVLGLLMKYIVDISGGEQASIVYDFKNINEDINEFRSLSGPYPVFSDFINQRLGLDLPDEQIINLLNNVEIATYSPDTKGELDMTAPFWRTDIELPEDIVEEVGRLYGFNKLPRELPTRSIAPAPKNPIFTVKQQVRCTLKAAGANEVLTYSFVHERILKNAGQNADEAFRLSNALSPDLQYYRLSLTPSLLDKVHPNIKAGSDAFALFEFGKAHRVGDTDDDGLPREYDRLALVWAAKKTTETGYYVAKRYLETLALDVHFAPLSTYDISEHAMIQQMVRPFEPKRSAVVLYGDRLVGVVGEYTASARAAFKLPEGAAGFEIFLSYLLHVTPRPYVRPSRFPSVTQDISLKVSADITYEAVFSAVRQAVDDNQLGECETSLQPLSIYQADSDAEHKTITLRLSIASYEKTLTDKDVSTIMDAVAEKTREELKAERI